MLRRYKYDTRVRLVLRPSIAAGSAISGDLSAIECRGASCCAFFDGYANAAPRPYE